MLTSSATPIISRYEVRGYIVLQSGEKCIGWYDTPEEASAALIVFVGTAGCHTGYILDHKPSPREAQ